MTSNHTSTPTVGPLVPSVADAAGALATVGDSLVAADRVIRRTGTRACAGFRHRNPRPRPLRPTPAQGTRA